MPNKYYLKIVNLENIEQMLIKSIAEADLRDLSVYNFS